MTYLAESHDPLLLFDVSKGANQIAHAPSQDRTAVGTVNMHIDMVVGGKLAWRHDARSTNNKVRPTERIRGLCFSPDGSKLHVAAGERLYTLDAATGETVWEYTPPRSFGFLVISPMGVSVDAEGNIGATFDNGTIGVWDAEGNLKGLWKDNDTPRFFRLAEGRLVGTDTFSIASWDTQTRRKIQRTRLPDRCYGANFCQGARLAVLRGLHCAFIMDTETGELIGQAPVGDGLPLVAFRPGRKEIALAEQHAVRLHDFEGTLLARFPIDERVISMAFTPSGDALSVGLESGSTLNLRLS